MRPLLVVLLLLAGAAEARSRDLALNQTSIDSINKAAVVFTGHACQGNYKVSDMMAAASPAALKFSYDTMASLFESQTGRFPGSRVRKDFSAGSMGRIWFDLGSSGLPSTFVLEAIQPYQGSSHVLSYGCWLK